MARTKQKVREDVEARRSQAAARPTDGLIDPTTIGDADGPKYLPGTGSGDTSTSIPKGHGSGSKDAGGDGSEEGEEEEEYAVQHIVTERMFRNKLQYEVKWVGYEDTTWEPAAHLANTAALEEYQERKLQEEAAVLAELDEDDADEEAGSDDDEDNRAVAVG